MPSSLHLPVLSFAHFRWDHGDLPRASPALFQQSTARLPYQSAQTLRGDHHAFLQCWRRERRRLLTLLISAAEMPRDRNADADKNFRRDCDRMAPIQNMYYTPLRYSTDRVSIDDFFDANRFHRQTDIARRPRNTRREQTSHQPRAVCYEAFFLLSLSDARRQRIYRQRREKAASENGYIFVRIFFLLTGSMKSLLQWRIEHINREPYFWVIRLIFFIFETFSFFSVLILLSYLFIIHWRREYRRDAIWGYHCRRWEYMRSFFFSVSIDHFHRD